MNIFKEAKQKKLQDYIEYKTGTHFKKVGNSLRADKCPFCENKTAFNIKKELFHCFRCDCKGDIIDFEAKYSCCSRKQACYNILDRQPQQTHTVKSREIHKFIWEKSTPLDEKTAYNWLKNKRNFPTQLANKTKSIVCKRFRLNTYKGTKSIVVPIYSYTQTKIIGIENISLTNSSKKAHGNKKGIFYAHAESKEVIIVESLANALCLASVGISAISIFGVTNSDGIQEIIKNFPNHKLYLWFDKGTENLGEELLLKHREINAIFFEEQKRDKYDVNDLLKESPRDFHHQVQKYIQNAIVSPLQSEQKNLIARNKVPKFPIHVIPEPIQSFCKEVADTVACPVDFVVTPMLTTIGALIGSHKKIQIKNSWQESSAIYTAVVAAPGSGKSPALAKITNLLKKIEEENAAENFQRQKQYVQEKARYDAELQKWKNEVKRGAPADYPPEEPQPFHFIRTHIADATVESISEILANNPRGVILIRDELTAWVKSHNQYKGGNGSDRQFFLSVWAGASCPVDRKGKEPQYITDPFLAITGAIPPKELDTLKKGMQDDGFIDRILFSYPDPTCTTKWSEKEISPTITKKMQQLFLGLYHDNSKKVIDFSPKAKKIWIGWYEFHKAKSIEQEEILQNPLNKMPGQLLRICLILATLSGEDHLTEHTLRGAIEIIEYYKAHLRRSLGILNETETEEKVRKIIDYAKKRNLKSISTKDIYRSRFMKIQKAAPAKELLQWAAEEGIGIFEGHTLHLHDSVFEDFDFSM
ncbi:DUF3987 domain-containing protein [Candidatus Uabimicrobium amorphum]|uniref:Zinc finger CHC2-type domain-containing protein n=1 Tax=Uabimicrobium amorphum TaxID=2596890 RepID=A0A5S9IK27_UABAM|nr:DUF3987 domain-containing protein [Candidatus Uabimicrobium amorphum]BBM83329.1 hypothetical protein UABAM_01681 [Candidatus Uabimicrobium amorphum]